MLEKAPSNYFLKITISNKHKHNYSLSNNNFLVKIILGNYYK